MRACDAGRRAAMRCLLGAAWLTTSGAPTHAAEQASEAPFIETLAVGGAQLELQLAPGFNTATCDAARAWVKRSALAVTDYFGRFPVTRAELLFIPVDGAGVGNGVSYGEPEVLVRIRVGRDTTPAEFVDDWVLVHEMVHLAVPGLPRAHRWFHEGVATYVEAIARTRAGLVAEADLWTGLARGLPQGQPKDGDEGLDNTHTWGRTYWGGALFCLLADVQIRQRSHGSLGLQHALRGVLAAGGNYSVRWPIERIVSVADAAVAQSSLSELYALMKDCPRTVDLDAMWRDLGVALPVEGTATLHDEAPLAKVRRAIVMS